MRPGRPDIQGCYHQPHSTFRPLVWVAGDPVSKMKSSNTNNHIKQIKNKLLWGCVACCRRTSPPFQVLGNPSQELDDAHPPHLHPSPRPIRAVSLSCSGPGRDTLESAAGLGRQIPALTTPVAAAASFLFPNLFKILFVVPSKVQFLFPLISCIYFVQSITHSQEPQSKR